MNDQNPPIESFPTTPVAPTTAIEVSPGPPTQKPVPENLQTSRLRLSIGVLPGLAVIAATIVCTAGLTFLATRPEVKALDQDITTAQAEASRLAGELTAERVTARVCGAASEAAGGSLNHWSAYMDDVQSLLLAESPDAVAKTMPNLQSSYRAVVKDKVPTASVIAQCARLG